MKSIVFIVEQTESIINVSKPNRRTTGVIKIPLLFEELTFDHESPSEVVNAKLVTNDGTMPNPLNLHSDWSNDFSDAPNFFWGDLYCYLIYKKGYDQESLKAYKSLEEYCLHWDGHVYNLERNKNIYFEHHIMKFSVKPTVREKTPLGDKPTYDGWIIIHKDGVVLFAHCPCIGG